MSQTNVEMAKRAYEAWNRGDMAAVLETFDPDVEWWDRGDSFHTTVRRGHDGLRGGRAEIAEAFSEFRMEPKEFIDAGDYVVVPIHRVGTGRGSGALIEELGTRHRVGHVGVGPRNASRQGCSPRRDYGYGVVFIALLEDGRPVGSEWRVQAQNVMAQEWVDGKTVRITSYADIDEARAAAERLAAQRGQGDVGEP